MEGRLPCGFATLSSQLRGRTPIPEYTSDAAWPPVFRTQLHVATSLTTGGGPVSYVQLPEGGFQVVYPRDLRSWFSGVVKVQFGCGMYFCIYTCISLPKS